MKKNVSLKLRAGDWVKVRSIEEILETIDFNNSINGMPFMPEMLEYTGQQHKVYKRADKTCDTISGKNESRRMVDTVHLEGLRCDGTAHDDCDATCLIFWKEAWLEKISVVESKENAGSISELLKNAKSNIEQLYAHTGKQLTITGGKAVYKCQATEILNASKYLYWKNILQYLREVTSGNIPFFKLMKVLSLAFVNFLHRRFVGGHIIPYIDKKLLCKEPSTPSNKLDLQPGEYVRIKELKEILPTLNREYKNRGLYFDKEMVRYCGKEAKVLKRVKRIINEKTGEMMVFDNDCIILDGVVCCGDLSENRLLCPRSIYSYWREIWLERI